MSASVIDFASGKVAEDEKQAALGARRRSLEARERQIRRAFKDLVEDEAEAAGEPVWNVVGGGTETVIEVVDRATKDAMRLLASDNPGGAHDVLAWAARRIELALLYAQEREEKKRKARAPQVRKPRLAGKGGAS